MAKSYLRSLPPWKSVTLLGTGFGKTPHTVRNLYKELSPYAIANHSSPSFESLKRNYLDSGLKDTFDGIRNIRHKATEKECIYHDSSNLSVFEYRDASSNLSLKLPAKGNCVVGALTLMDESVELSNPVRAGSIICVNLIPEGAVNAVQTTAVTSFCTTLP